MKLYSYWRASSPWRVRIALNLKKLDYETVPVHLVKDGGEQFGAAYKSLNPAGRIPALVVDNEDVLTQSLAILEYLEETHPAPALLPVHPVDRAKARAFAMAIACDVQAMQNLSTLTYLKTQMHQSEDAINAWVRHWITQQLTPLEQQAKVRRDRFLFGFQPGFAECCLVPQMFGARRFGVEVQAYPALLEVEEACLELDAFRKAAPENQPDAA